MLRSPYSSDDDSVIHSTRSDITKRVQFNSIDLSNPVLVVGNAFHDVAEFRNVVRQYNILRGKDFIFKRNEKKVIVIACKDTRSKYGRRTFGAGQ